MGFLLPEIQSLPYQQFTQSYLSQSRQTGGSV